MVFLKKASVADAEELYQMQVQAFLPLLYRYRDYETNPAAEEPERTLGRLQREGSHYYFILQNGKKVGAIRIQQQGETCRISPIFVLPEHQGNGYAQKALALVEDLYPGALRWELDTILQEPKLCHLYEKSGYCQTGEEIPVNDKMSLVVYQKIMKGRRI